MPLPTNTSGPHVPTPKKCGQIAMKVKKIAYSTLWSTIQHTKKGDIKTFTFYGDAEIDVLHQTNPFNFDCRYTVSVRVEEKQPYRQRTYTWCWAFPPRCSKYKIQIKTIYRTEVSFHQPFIMSKLKYVWEGKTQEEEEYVVKLFMTLCSGSRGRRLIKKGKTLLRSPEKQPFVTSSIFSMRRPFQRLLSKKVLLWLSSTFIFL